MKAGRVRILHQHAQHVTPVSFEDPTVGNSRASLLRSQIFPFVYLNLHFPCSTLKAIPMHKVTSFPS